MIKCYNSSNECIPTFKRTMVLIVFLIAFLYQDISAQSNFTAESGTLSNLPVAFIKNQPSRLDHSKYLNAEGNFLIKDGYLDGLKAFSLSIPLSAVNEVFAADSTKGRLEFKLTHVMILPILGMVHIVGDLEMAGVSKRTELDFKYKVNQDQSLTLIGSKAIKLTDYKAGLISNNLTKRNSNEINLELNILFKNNQPTFLAAN